MEEGVKKAGGHHFLPGSSCQAFIIVKNCNPAKPKTPCFHKRCYCLWAFTLPVLLVCSNVNCSLCVIFAFNISASPLSFLKLTVMYFCKRFLWWGCSQTDEIWAYGIKWIIRWCLPSSDTLNDMCVFSFVCLSSEQIKTKSDILHQETGKWPRSLPMMKILTTCKSHLFETCIQCVCRWVTFGTINIRLLPLLFNSWSMNTPCELYTKPCVVF